VAIPPARSERDENAPALHRSSIADPATASIRDPRIRAE
jgi:hypothetical protein